jgi:hypothetical protein
MGRRILSAATKAKISASLKGNKNAYSGGPKKVSKPRKPLTARQKVANINAAAKKKKMTLSPDAIERRRKVAQRLRTVARQEEAGISPAHSKPIPKPNRPDPSDPEREEIQVRIKGKLKGAVIVNNGGGPMHLGSGNQYNTTQKSTRDELTGRKIAKINSGNGKSEFEKSRAIRKKLESDLNSVVPNNSRSKKDAESLKATLRVSIIDEQINTIIIQGQRKAGGGGISAAEAKRAKNELMSKRNDVLAVNFYRMHGTAGLEKKIASMDKNITTLSKKDYNLLGALKEVRDGNRKPPAASRAKPPADPMAKHANPKALPRPKKTQAEKDLDAKERRLYGGRKPPTRPKA